jgi:Fe-Mn family superoxide dismutase
MSASNSRRKFIANGMKGTMALGLINTLSSFESFHQPTPFQQAPLSYAFGALEPMIDSMTMEIHYTKHAATYTKNLNDAAAAEVKENKSLEEILRNISTYSAKLRNNGGGHFNHELFWKCMQPVGGSLQEGVLKNAINSSFGSYENFKNKLSEAAMTRFGSGWAWLYVDEKKSLQIGSTPNQDNPLMDVSPIKGTPILGLDVWEHAYYLKYQNRRAEYVSNWFNIVNWNQVENNLISIGK